MSPYIFLTIGAVILVLFVAFMMRISNRARLIQELNMGLLSVQLPFDFKESAGQKDFKDEINLSAQLFSVLCGQKTPFCVEAAVHHAGSEIIFYVSVPKIQIEAVSRQIEGLFRGVRVKQVEDYNIFVPSGNSAGIFAKQKYPAALPLRTYVEANVDTFAPILSGLSKISEAGEGAAIQVIAKPAAFSDKKEIFQKITALKKGSKLEDVMGGMKITLSDIGKAALGSNEEKEEKEKIFDQEAIKALETKASKQLLSVNFRIAVSAASQLQTDSLMDGISNGFSQFFAPSRQDLKISKPKNLQKFFYQFSFREFDEAQKMVLNTEELASLFHFPTSTTDIPRVKWLKSKEAAPPSAMAKLGTQIGESLFRGEQIPVFISEEDRRRHIYVIGQTGTGKSNLLINMAVDDIKKGKGVSVIDPHGDLINAILGLIPKNKANDVIVFDPSDLWRPLGINMLEYDIEKPEQKTFVVNEMFSILDKLYDMKTVGGPMFEQYTKNAILLLMEDIKNEPATLMEIPRVFTDDNFRKKKIARITNPAVVDFWTKEAAAATGEHSLANMSGWITSKFNNFISNDYMRPIIGQTKSSFNFREAMDFGKIILVNLSKGRIGDINANLLGMVVVGKILMAALSRVDVQEKDRRDFSLFIDEFQNFTTESSAVIMSEARKYRLNLTVAHQFIAQLNEKIKDAVFGNVGSKVVFRIGAPDAEFLAKEFEPVFSQRDLTNIDNFNAYVKILVNGQTAPPFNIRTLPAAKGSSEFAEQIKEFSRNKYGKDRQEVEDEIMKRLRT